MNTTTAAAEARVTAATIRTWCRRGVVTATKTAGRWIVDATSLAHRIAIGAMRARKAAVTTQHPILATSKTRSIPGHIGAVGPADVLKTAFDAGTPVTLSGKFEGEQVYLGHTRQTYGDYGITLETIGLDHELGESPQLPGVYGAVYLIDLDRLDEAPRLAQLLYEADERAAAAEARAAAQDNDYLNPDYE